MSSSARFLSNSRCRTPVGAPLDVTACGPSKMIFRREYRYALFRADSRSIHSECDESVTTRETTSATNCLIRRSAPRRKDTTNQLVIVCLIFKQISKKLGNQSWSAAAASFFQQGYPPLQWIVSKNFRKTQILTIY